jgi:hypothetical protein
MDGDEAIERTSQGERLIGGVHHLEYLIVAEIFGSTISPVHGCLPVTGDAAPIPKRQPCHHR